MSKRKRWKVQQENRGRINQRGTRNENAVVNDIFNYDTISNQNPTTWKTAEDAKKKIADEQNGEVVKQENEVVENAVQEKED